MTFAPNSTSLISRWGASLLGALRMASRLAAQAGSAEGVGEGLDVDQVEATPEAAHQNGDLLALLAAKPRELAGDLGMSVLAGLEFEDAIARPQLEVEGQRPEDVLQRLVEGGLVSQVPEAVAHPVSARRMTIQGRIAGRAAPVKVVLLLTRGRLPATCPGNQCPTKRISDP